MEIVCNRLCRQLNSSILMGMLLLFCSTAVWPETRGKPVAVAIELWGKAETQLNGHIVQVGLLSEFEPGARLRLPRGTRLIVLMYRSGIPYQIDGPALLKIAETKLITLSGNEPLPQRQPSGVDGRPIQIQPTTVAQAATVVRGVWKPIPALCAKGGIVLERYPRLCWSEPESDLEYVVTVMDSDGHVIIDTIVRGTQLDLPELSEGQSYRWAISAKSGNANSYGSTYRFSIASESQRRELENFRAGLGTSPGEKVIFALWLAQSGYLEESTRYREEISAEGIVFPVKAAEGAP